MNVEYLLNPLRSSHLQLENIGTMATRSPRCPPKRDRLGSTTPALSARYRPALLHGGAECEPLYPNLLMPILFSHCIWQGRHLAQMDKSCEFWPIFVENRDTDVPRSCIGRYNIEQVVKEPNLSYGDASVWPVGREDPGAVYHHCWA